LASSDDDPHAPDVTAAVCRRPRVWDRAHVSDRTTTQALRTVRLRARVPRFVAGLVAAVLVAAGLRATIAPSAAPAPVRVTRVAAGDQAAGAYAEAFARAYLTWDADRPDERQRRLAPYVADLDADGGVQPATDTTQRVVWTAVVGQRREQDTSLVTVAAQTSGPLLYLSIPVARSARGYLFVAGYPAIVGAPASDQSVTATPDADVEDDALVSVVSRALRNYLAANRSNLLADLTPDALVSLPAQPLTVTAVDQVTWLAANRRVAVQLHAQDRSKNTWTLRYELDVRRTDRWYVRSVQVDPRFRGGPS
jgi:hypothetical protein